MAETLLFQGVAVNPANGLRLRLGHNVETLAGTKTLRPQDAQVQVLDPGGAGRDVTLPAEGASQGLFFVVKNAADAAETLTVKDDGGSPIDTLAQARFGIFVCDGSSWVSAVGEVTYA
tara:strand:+ start:175 stop:528 length:354 start_codon:yes stop_codon:yes gene_type:complete